MLGVGWSEMLLIGVVALIVIGPKDLPVLMHRIGKFAGTIRRMGNDFQRELNKTTGLNEITNLRNAVTAPLKATTDAIRKEFNTITAEGTVEPSGALKPADPEAQSVVAEINAKAGITQPATPATSTTDAPVPVMTPLAATTIPAAAPVEAIAEPATEVAAKPKRVRKPKAAATAATVAIADVGPVDATPARYGIGAVLPQAEASAQSRPAEPQPTSAPQQAEASMRPKPAAARGRKKKLEPVAEAEPALPLDPDAPPPAPRRKPRDRRHG